MWDKQWRSSDLDESLWLERDDDVDRMALLFKDKYFQFLVSLSICRTRCNLISFWQQRRERINEIISAKENGSACRLACYSSICHEQGKEPSVIFAGYAIFCSLLTSLICLSIKVLLALLRTGLINVSEVSSSTVLLRGTIIDLEEVGRRKRSSVVSNSEIELQWVRQRRHALTRWQLSSRSCQYAWLGWCCLTFCLSWSIVCLERAG